MDRKVAPARFQTVRQLIRARKAAADPSSVGLFGCLSEVASSAGVNFSSAHSRDPGQGQARRAVLRIATHPVVVPGKSALRAPQS